LVVVDGSNHQKKSIGTHSAFLKKNLGFRRRMNSVIFPYDVTKNMATVQEKEQMFWIV
jgi:hypothetical protein